MKKLATLLLMTVLCLNTQAEDQSKHINLSGTWHFSLDFTAKSEETTHLTRPWSYKGRAWYQREVEIPTNWKGKSVYLFLERTKPSEVYIDGKLVGQAPTDYHGG